MEVFSQAEHTSTPLAGSSARPGWVSVGGVRAPATGRSPCLRLGRGAQVAIAVAKQPFRGALDASPRRVTVKALFSPVVKERRQALQLQGAGASLAWECSGLRMAFQGGADAAVSLSPRVDRDNSTQRPNKEQQRIGEAKGRAPGGGCKVRANARHSPQAKQHNTAPPRRGGGAWTRWWFSYLPTMLLGMEIFISLGLRPALGAEGRDSPFIFMLR